MENQESNSHKTAHTEVSPAQGNLPGSDQQKKQADQTERTAHNTGDEHMRIDEEGTEIDADDQA
ncbi:hypothetical protein [Pedobacter sp. L105]|uniref:hypothetical protein n=1 Tax=Pedobacter sp. L105 TaxID=1641871 RepID=UPI00131E0254|nr:hypothetical protein [Pedobacter sp. L105]